VEAYGEGLYLAMKEQADLETRSMEDMGRYGKPGGVVKN